MNPLTAGMKSQSQPILFSPSHSKKPSLGEEETSPKNVSTISTEISTSRVVKAISRLVLLAESQDRNKLIPCVSETVSEVRKILDQTEDYRTREIAQSNQVMIQLLADLVRIVKSNELTQVRSIAILIVNELKNSMLLVQNLNQ